MSEHTWPGRPPAGSILDSTSPYYKNLVAAYLFNDAASDDANGTGAKNLVNNTLAALTSSGYDSLTWSPSGLVLGRDAHRGIDLTPLLASGSGLPCTMVILHKPLFTNATFPMQMAAIGSGNSMGQHGDFTLRSATTIGIDSYGTVPYIATVPDMTGATVVTAVNSSSAGNTLYQNGINVGTTSGNVFAANAYFQFGSGGSGGGGYTGTVSAIYVYVGRQLTDAEHAYLAVNPYAPIIPIGGSISTTSPGTITLPSSTPLPNSLVSVKVTSPRGCLPGETEIAYLDISTVNGATDADSLPVVTVALLNQMAMTAITPSITHVVTGLYKISVPIPAGCTWCDDICIIGTVTVGDKTFNWVVEFSLPTVATDAAGGVILQPSEHINEVPLDVVSTLLQYSLCEYVDPANPTTSALRFSPQKP